MPELTNTTEVSQAGDLLTLTSEEYHRSTTLQIMSRRETGNCTAHDGKLIIHRVLCHLETEWYFREYGLKQDRWYGRGYSFIQLVLGLHGVRGTVERTCKVLDACYGVRVDWRLL